MNAYSTLLENLDALIARRRELQDQGLVLFDCWIAESRPGGTARTKKSHGQLRSRKAQFDGKKSRYLKAAEVETYQEAIARGKALRQLDKQIATLQKRIGKIEAIASQV